jgi:hypothetical protein
LHGTCAANSFGVYLKLKFNDVFCIFIRLIWKPYTLAVSQMIAAPLASVQNKAPLDMQPA